MIAARNDPEPVSLVLVTVKVAAPAGPAIIDITATGSDLRIVDLIVLQGTEGTTALLVRNVTGGLAAQP
jgi:hypothetical protein